MVIVINIYNQKDNCYGCSACYNACPRKAITMEEDREGFLYPVVNQEQCIICGRCHTVCPIRAEEVEVEGTKQRIYAVKHTDEMIRRVSTSGGMFTALSDYVLSLGGSVYGAVLGEKLQICHERAVTKEVRNRMRGSKYVQSELGDTFSIVKKDLEDGKRVLFTGTPCQIAGLTKYLDYTDQTNLILCDVICYGVPNNKLWLEYVKFVEDKKHAKLKTHYFRSKITGWHNISPRNIFCDNSEDSKSIISQLNMNLFLSKLTLRPCCYHCRFTSFLRVSDITLGDFWGIDKSEPDFDDNQGISLVMINTEKGNEVFQAIKEILDVRESDQDNCHQHNLEAPTTCPRERKQFWKDYNRHGYPYILKKYAGYTLMDRCRHNSLLLFKKLKKRPYIGKVIKVVRRN